MIKRMLLGVIVLVAMPGSTLLIFAQKAPSPEERPSQALINYQAEPGVPKDEAGEKRRDYAVLEAALNDLTSPRNPEYKYHIKSGGPGREIVVDDNTYDYDDGAELDDKSSNIDKTDSRSIPADIQEDFKRRNDGRARSLKDFKPANPSIVMRDLDKMFEVDDPLEEFRKAYPDAWGFVWAYLPGYSKDGETAVVLFEGGPNGIHSLNWVYMLAKKRNRWEVQWRHCCPHE